MSDEPTKTPATPLSTTAGNATLDDVLSSLQLQVEKNAPAPITPATEPALQTSEAQISPVTSEATSPAIPQDMPVTTQEETKSSDAPSVAEAVVPVSEEKPAENLTEAIQPLAMASATPDAMMAQAPGIEPTTTQEVTIPAPFSIEEKTIEAAPSQPIVPPTAEAMPQSLSEHPAVNIEPVPSVSPTFDAPSTPPAPAPEKKGGLFGFAFNPKFAIAGVVALIVLVGSVVTYATFVANRTNTDTRDKACEWICTANCGCGCKDYFDNGRQSCYGTTNPTNAPGPTAAPSGCSSSAPTASACYGKAFGTNVGPCTCQRSGSSGNVCACVSNTTCAGAGGSCYTGSACSGLNPPRSVANGGNGCGPGIVCCAGTVPGATVKPSTTPAPTVKPSITPTPRPTTTTTPTAPPSTGTCGGSGQNCCDPFSNGGLICSSNLYCNTSTGKCQTTVPGGLCQTNGGTPNGMCEVYTCGSSCNLGNQCNLNKQVVPCSSATLNGQCGQIDYLNTNGQYCGVKSQNCGASCGGTSTPPPTPRVTPTPTPIAKCGTTCTTNANCPTGLICSTGKCRNAACVASTTCVCATPTPTPSPTPTPTPTPPPLACIRITSDTPNPVLGSQVRFTCGLVTGANRYEFRYKYAFGGTDVGGTLTATNNISEQLNVSVAGVYKVQCRPCVGNACSQWETW